MNTPTNSRNSNSKHRNSAYAAEAAGLLLIAVLMLFLTIIRYGHRIPWSAR